jgi:hypothetical protein
MNALNSVPTPLIQPTAGPEKSKFFQKKKSRFFQQKQENDSLKGVSADEEFHESDSCSGEGAFLSE